MKKLIAIFLFSIITNFAYSQSISKLNSYAAVRGEYNPVNKKYIYKTPVIEDNIINITSTHIYVNDRVNSIYKIVNDFPLASREVIYSVNAIDQDQRKCIISIMRLEGDDSLHLTILYTNVVVYLYHLTNK
jgi:hypothetical protein